MFVVGGEATEEAAVALERELRGESRGDVEEARGLNEPAAARRGLPIEIRDLMQIGGRPSLPSPRSPSIALIQEQLALSKPF